MKSDLRGQAGGMGEKKNLWWRRPREEICQWVWLLDQAQGTADASEQALLPDQPPPRGPRVREKRLAEGTLHSDALSSCMKHEKQVVLNL